MEKPAEKAPERAAPPKQKPSLGRVVHYALSQADLDALPGIPGPKNPHELGQLLPMDIVRVWDTGVVNGQVKIDGAGTLWVTSVAEGTAPGTWRWPERA